MRSKKIICLACVLAGATLLASCSSCAGNQEITFTAGWLSDTTNKVLPANAEELTYAVTYDKAEGLYSESYTVNYTNGEYKTSLKASEYEGQAVYEYTSTLTINVQYTLKKTGETTAFETPDKVETVVYFKTAANGLTPLKSTKTTYCHSPNGTEATKLQNCYTEYHYTVETVYTGSKGKSTITNHLNEDKKQTNPSFSAKHDEYTYLDNEQLLFALRGMGTSATSISSYQPLERAKKVVSVSVGDKKGGEFEFTIDGKGSEKRAIDYRAYTLTFDADNPGASQEAWIASTTDTTSNVYRNVMLKLETPISYSAGSLIYTLTSAKFAN
ncbi:MAG: hypothetical protein IJ506_08270 [Clostridia bacterium]|nr:hypothetical protein [Clostridia bacterium]